jgi:agmatinase
MTAHARFKAPLTLLGVPLSDRFHEARIVVLGVPFDCGADPTRFGSRMGPNAIRQGSALASVLLVGADADPRDRVIDAGNVDLDLTDREAAFRAIEAAMDEILSAGARPLALGGDGAVTLPQLRAVHKAHGRVAVLHFDAHTDAWPPKFPGDYDNTNQLSYAVSEGLIDPTRSIHVGTRGPIDANHIIDQTRSLGYEVITYDEVRNWGEQRLLERLRHRLADLPVYLCFDMDFFDPSVAPGVATPEPGGASAAEGLALLRGLTGLNIVASDINTMTPIHDTGGVTAALAAAVAVECLALMGDSHR